MKMIYLSMNTYHIRKGVSEFDDVVGWQTHYHLYNCTDIINCQTVGPVQYLKVTLLQIYPKPPAQP